MKCGMYTMLDWDYVEMRVEYIVLPSPPVNSLVNDQIESPEFQTGKITDSASFAQRRKKLRNTLSKAPKRISRVAGWHAKAYRDAMQHIECDFIEERPEDLEIEDWLELAQLLEDAREAMG